MNEAELEMRVREYSLLIDGAVSFPSNRLAKDVYEGGIQLVRTYGKGPLNRKSVIHIERDKIFSVQYIPSFLHTSIEVMRWIGNSHLILRSIKPRLSDRYRMQWGAKEQPFTFEESLKRIFGTVGEAEIIDRPGE